MSLNGRVKRIEKMLTGQRAVPKEELMQMMEFYSEPPETIEAAILKRKEELCAKYGEAALGTIKFLIYKISKVIKPANAGTSGIE